MRHPVDAARVYDVPAGPREGATAARILIDRLWPRGMSRERAALEIWLREIAPSDQLRTWYGHDPARHAEFRTRYLAELTEPARATALETLRGYTERAPVILLTATKDVSTSHAPILVDLLTATPGRAP